MPTNSSSVEAAAPKSRRQIGPVPLWSAVIRPNVEFEEFTKKLGNQAQRDRKRWTGFLTLQDEVVLSFTRTSSPRKSPGLPSSESFARGMAALARSLKTEVEPDPQTTGLRIILGLQGHSSTKPHTIQEVRDRLGPAIDITPATGLTLWVPVGEKPSVLTEPVAVIGCGLAVASEVHILAENYLRLEDYTVENFDAHHHDDPAKKGLVYMMQTPHL